MSDYRKRRNKICYLFIRLLIVTLIVFIACSNKLSNEDEILKLYSDLSIEFSNGNLRGIMKPVSKEFKSEIRLYGNYEDVKMNTAQLLRTNRNIVIDFLNFEINISNDKAEARYNLHFISDQTEYSVEVNDYLEKTWGGWKITSREHLD